jgi:predicted metal-binding transcription factor (methanogenesis marker protein 9)
MDEVREKAKGLGIKTARMKKEDLIRAVQAAEGNFPCFGTASECCDREDCCWIDDCLDR